MKAAQINAYGGAEEIRITDEAARPAASTGEVVVAVRAAGVNPFDRKVREGQMRAMAELGFPAILGGDFAGVVASTGPGVVSVQPGDEVYGQAPPLSGHGSFAEFTTVKTETLAQKPKNLSFAEAAAAPLAAVSAYQALVEHMHLQSGQKILIHGGAGGIGTFAIQLAKHLGAYVATTATGQGMEYAKNLGADEVIDYKTQNFTDTTTGLDAVFDTIGGDTYKQSFKTLKPGGIIVSMLEQPNEALMEKYNVRAVAQFTKVTAKRLEAIASLLERGALRVHIGRTFPLEQAGEAQEYLQSGKHLGKVVITVV